jgi:hypothetical protein
MSENLVSYVRGVSAPGPKSKAVSLGVDAEGVALWTWMAKDAVVVPGMTFSCESVSFGELQESYTKDGVEVALKRPKRQVFCHAVAVLGAPEAQEVVSEVQVTPEALEFAQRVQAKAEADATDDGEEPF